LQTLILEIARAGAAVDVRSLSCQPGRPLKLGRLASAEVQLDDPGVARLQAVLTPHASHADLVDLGTRGGTFVNGSRIDRARLVSGDAITVGDTQIKLWLGPRPQVLSLPTVPDALVAMPNAAAAAVRFDGEPEPLVARPSADQVQGSAVLGRPHPSIAPERPLTACERTLELRVYWGQVLLDVRHYSSPASVTIGETRGCDIFLTSEDLPIERFPLLRGIAGEWLLAFADVMEGELEVGGVSRQLASVRASSLATRDAAIPGCSSVTLATDSRALVHWGGVTLAIRFVPSATPIPPERTKDLDFPFLNTLLMSSLLHVAVVAVLLLFPYDLQAIKGDRGLEAVFELIQRPAPVQPRSRPPKALPRPSVLEMKASKPAASTPSSTFVNDARQPIRSQGNGLSREAQMARIQARMNALFGRNSQGLGRLQGQGTMNAAGTLANVISTLAASDMGEDVIGDGPRGDGPTTGGLGGTSMDIAAIGPADGLGRCTKGTCLGPDMRKRPDRDLPLEFRPPRFGEALPREIIRRIIDENKGQIRYCYERELQRNAELEGMVRIKLVIGATGRVAVVVVTDSTLNNPAAEECMRQKISTWVFPPPSGGGRVDVNYPFIFRSLDK
jgi:hypothetical protein